MQTPKEQARSLSNRWVANPSPADRAVVLNELTAAITPRGLAVMFHFGAELQQLEDSARREDDYDLAASYDLEVVTAALEKFASDS